LRNADQCQFLDVKTSLVWSERAPTLGDDETVKREFSTDWWAATNACRQLSYWGGATAWRLPTSAELAGAYRHGLSRIAQKYADGFGSAANGFWASDWIDVGDAQVTSPPLMHHGFLQWLDLNDGAVKRDSFQAVYRPEANPPFFPEPKSASRGWVCVRHAIATRGK
jgi:hypothetical protein